MKKLFLSPLMSFTYKPMLNWKTPNQSCRKTLGTPEGDAKKAITQTKKDLKALEEDAADPF